MNRQEQLLTILMEECSEVIKECSKALRFSLDEKWSESEFTNRERIQNELKDVLCVIDILSDEEFISYPFVTTELVEKKKEKIEKYFEISRRYGALT